MSLDAVIFDVDGTLADTEAVQLLALNTLLKPLGVSITPEEWAMQYVGNPIKQCLSKVHTTYHVATSLEEFTGQRRAMYSTLIRQSEYLKPAEGIISFLDELDARKISYGLASGSPLADIQDVLLTLGLGERMRVIAAGDQVAHPKPAPDVYLRAAALLNVSPLKCMAIEDSATGIASAQAAGMRVIGIPSDFTRHQNLGQADVILADFNQVARWLFSSSE